MLVDDALLKDLQLTKLYKLNVFNQISERFIRIESDLSNAVKGIKVALLEDGLNSANSNSELAEMKASGLKLEEKPEKDKLEDLEREVANNLIFYNFPDKGLISVF